MLYTEAQQMSLNIFFIGTVLAGLHQEESRQLYLALNQVGISRWGLLVFELMLMHCHPDASFQVGAEKVEVGRWTYSNASRHRQVGCGSEPRLFRSS